MSPCFSLGYLYRQAGAFHNLLTHDLHFYPPSLAHTASASDLCTPAIAILFVLQILSLWLNSVVGIAKLNVDDDASCIITHAYQPCLLHSSPVRFRAPVPESPMSGAMMCGTTLKK